MKTANQTDFFEHYRELTFTNLSADSEIMSLAIADPSMNQGQGGFYKLPLYSTTPREEDSDAEPNAEIELVHLYPLIHNSLTQDKAEVSILPKGYIFLFVDGYFRLLISKYRRRSPQ